MRKENLLSSQKYSGSSYLLSYQSGTAAKLIYLLHSKTVIQKIPDLPSRNTSPREKA